MKLNDRDGSLLALPYVFSAYPIPVNPQSTSHHPYRLEVYSAGKASQHFHYRDESTRKQDYEFINRWIQHVEMGASMPQPKEEGNAS